MAATSEATARVDPITIEVLRSAFIATCNEMALTVAKTAYSTPVNEGPRLRHRPVRPPRQPRLTGRVRPARVRGPHIAHCAGGHAADRTGESSSPAISTSSTTPTWRRPTATIFTSSSRSSTAVSWWASRHPPRTGPTWAAWRRGRSTPQRAATTRRGCASPPSRCTSVGCSTKTSSPCCWSTCANRGSGSAISTPQIASVKVGEQRILKLIEKHGVAAMLATMAEVQDHSERLARAAFAGLPDGVYDAEDSVDQDQYTGQPKTNPAHTDDRGRSRHLQITRRATAPRSPASTGLSRGQRRAPLLPSPPSCHRCR